MGWILFICFILAITSFTIGYELGYGKAIRATRVMLERF